mmetsp:Transcript_28850/g.67475  ORF Transcript_28850/g.67475 Transcript_28850/m.67475 type:complete len:411 (+) Transcript_28850:411-1643(+)
MPSHQLRCHPVGGPNHRVPHVLLLRELHAKAKVCDLDLAPRVDEDVVALDVTVDPPQAVQEGHCLERRLREGPHLPLGHVRPALLQRLHKVRQRAPVHVLHHHPQTPVEHEALEVLGHVWVRRRPHHRNLVLQRRQVRRLGQDQLLDGGLLLRLLVGSEVDGAHPTLPDGLWRQVVLGGGVPVDEGDGEPRLEAGLLRGRQVGLAFLLHLEAQNLQDGVTIALHLLLGELGLLELRLPPRGEPREARRRRGVNLDMNPVLEVEGSRDLHLALLRGLRLCGGGRCPLDRTRGRGLLLRGLGGRFRRDGGRDGPRLLDRSAFQAHCGGLGGARAEELEGDGGADWATNQGCNLLSRHALDDHFVHRHQPIVLKHLSTERCRPSRVQVHEFEDRVLVRLQHCPDSRHLFIPSL